MAGRATRPAFHLSAISLVSSHPVQIGPYKILKRLGAGGMGDLYLARDSRLGRQVAIKLLREETDSEGPRDRLLHEARAAASVHHPNAVTIFDVGEHDHQPFIAMEYLVGETLEELIRQKAPLALPRKLEIMRDVCSGVAAMHRAGLIHRDLKPSNIMVGDDGVVKILDFGVARAIGSPGRPGTIIGTLSYMSPEQSPRREWRSAGRSVTSRSPTRACRGGMPSSSRRTAEGDRTA